MHHSLRVSGEEPQPESRGQRGLWNRITEYHLRSRWASVAFVLALAVPGLILVFETSRIVIAETLNESFQPNSIRQAMALDPGNPAPHFELGKILLLTGDPSQQSLAEQEFRAAIQKNPDSAGYWAGLGMACYTMGEQPCADDAFTRAQQLAPGNPDYAWQAAVNDVVSGQAQAAIAEAKTFLSLQPEALTQTFQLLTRGLQNPQVVWDGLLGTSSDLQQRMKYVEFLAATDRVEAANALWQQLAAQKKAISLAQVAPYVDQLLASNHYTEAADVWQYARSSTNTAENFPGEPDLVFNGSFEQPPLNAGFDWHYRQQSYVDLSFADTTAKDGSHGLKAEFTVPQNAEYEVAYQFVPLAPNHSYQLSAFFKTQGITSDSGVRLRLIDPRCVACLDTSTKGPTGTTDWQRVTTQFATGPATDVVRLSLWRPRSRTYPTEITGQLWIDDVAIHPVSSPGIEQAAR